MVTQKVEIILEAPIDNLLLNRGVALCQVSLVLDAFCVDLALLMFHVRVSMMSGDEGREQGVVV